MDRSATTWRERFSRLRKNPDGIVAAAGSVNIDQPVVGGHPKVGASKGNVFSDSAILQSLWVDGFDSNPGSEDLQGLKKLEKNVGQLKAK